MTLATPPASPLLVAPGELRADHLRLFSPTTASPMELLLAAPGLLATGWPELTSFAEHPERGLVAAAAFQYRRAALAFFTRQIDALPHEPAWQEGIDTWREALGTGALKILHDRHEPAFTRLLCQAESTLVHPAPLTLSPAADEQEVRLELRGDAHLAARAWFMRRRDRADDISMMVKEVLEASWAGGLLSPEDLYFKVLIDYFSSTLDGMDLGDDDNELLSVMTEFQCAAYFHAKGILRRFGGVFLADVVGLGKTFIALALLRHLQDHGRQHGVVIAPPTVLPAWRELAAEFRIELQYVSYGKLDELERHADREVLVIDESHNFRNPRTQRQAALGAWLRPEGAAAWRKVILVSATPQNNRPRDVYNQLQLFPDTYSRLPYEGESLRTFFDAVEREQHSMTRLLQHVVVRRTRRFIQSAYPSARLRRRVRSGEYVEESLVFPRRVSGPEQCLRYLIDQTYPGGLYDQLLAVLADLRLPRQSLGTFVRPACREDHRIELLGRSPSNLRGLFKVLLLKRVESSVEALRCTLSRMIAHLQAMRSELDQGKVRLRSARDTDAGDDASDDDDDDVFAPASLFDGEALHQAIQHDLIKLSALLGGVEQIDPARDAKLQALRRYLATRPPGAHKILVFTQFADTAEYIGKNVGMRKGIAVATGARGGALALARRFAPVANRQVLREGEEIDLLIATDVLSEGVNLQDGDTLVNYDLHWNPVRLIQRAGRIDRIGSANEEIHIASFLPERTLEAQLGLETVLRARIGDFIRIFGEDFHVLPAEDRPVEADMLDAYTGRALEIAEADDDMDGLSRHIERILQLRREDPDRYVALRALRPGRRAVSSVTEGGVAAMRRGHFWRFYGHEADHFGVLDDCAALDRLHRHREGAAPVPPPQDAIVDLRELAAAARAAFEPEAQVMHARSSQPALDGAERWVQEQLEEFRASLPASQHPRIERAITWILRGEHKHLFQREARRWKRERLTSATVLDEMQRLVRSYPIDADDEVTVPELVAVLVSDRRLEIDKDGGERQRGGDEAASLAREVAPSPNPGSSGPNAAGARPTTRPSPSSLSEGEDATIGGNQGALPHPGEIAASTLALLHGVDASTSNVSPKRRRFRWR